MTKLEFHVHLRPGFLGAIAPTDQTVVRQSYKADAEHNHEHDDNRYQGHRLYPEAAELLILADSGGSNGARTRAWKHAVQERLADRHGLTVTVCHYPTSASKWHPIEHRLFSEVSKNWAGRPLDDYETILNYLRTTSTKTGLQVKAYLVERDYPTGIKISDEAMAELALFPHKTQPSRNYTIKPR